MRVDLIWLGELAPPKWNWGEVRWSTRSVDGVCNVVENELKNSNADWWLFWDGALGVPDASRIRKLATKPGDVWHAGLALGTGGQPGAIDFVAPTWMLNADPEPDIDATSWRMSLRAALIPPAVLRRMGGPRRTFSSLAAAGLEMGHRYLMRGVITRHSASLIGGNSSAKHKTIGFKDEIRFVLYRYGRQWVLWSFGRALLSGYASMKEVVGALPVVGEDRPSDPKPYREAESVNLRTEVQEEACVTVLIPTVDRYPYLRTLLGQLRNQRLKPHEVIVVDQTPLERRDATFYSEFSDLPLRVIELKQAGQCSSRNAGLQIIAGTHVLFLDDDVEIEPDLIEQHVDNLTRFSADVSCGTIHEIGSIPLPLEYRLVRLSDIFPTNNALIYKDVLFDTGLFDLAYDHGQRADGDLGMRIMLSGHMMVYDPNISVLHHHAPQGGLRTHKARVETYAESRQHVSVRHLPTKWDIYLSLRYFDERQVREMLWLGIFGTLAVRGGILKQTAKAAVGVLLLPDTVVKTYRRRKQAEQMLYEYPDIPILGL